jgi:hypothetical protein
MGSSCCSKEGKTGGMRFKMRINKIMQEFKKDIKTMEDTNPGSPFAIDFIREKSYLKAKFIIDHLELRGLDASKIATELQHHYNSK